VSRAALVLVLMLAQACALLPRDAARALAEADARAGQGDYAAAIAAYDAYLAQYPDDDDAGRARTARALLQQLLAVRTEASTLQAQLLTARTEARTLREKLSAREAELTSREAELTTRVAELTTREAELNRLRPDLAAREAEITKLRSELAARQSEAAKLREDLEKLKRIDLEMERRRR
jgi:chromosome segregation ATPase